jgi:ribosomal protein L7Ae-like RNA K-turn-binding protein
MAKKKNIIPSGNILYPDAKEALEKNLDKILGALGLAMNAGGLAVGSEAVTQAVDKGKARIVFIANDISAGTKDKLLSKLVYKETKYILLPCSMETLSRRLGKSGNTSAAALTRPGFEKIIFKCMDNPAVNCTNIGKE